MKTIDEDLRSMTEDEAWATLVRTCRALIQCSSPEKARGHLKALVPLAAGDGAKESDLDKLAQEISDKAVSNV